MNNCPECNHEMVNVIYGFPTAKLIDLARQEGVALGGMDFGPDQPTHYCYGCHEAFPKNEVVYDEE
jgi:hypothetical protein